MKNTIATLVVLSSVVTAQTYLKYPDVKLALQVVDENSVPVGGLKTYASGDDFIPYELSCSQVDADADGKALHTFKALSLASYLAKGEGVYTSMTKDLYAFKLDAFTNKEAMRRDSSVPPEFVKSIDLEATLVVRRIKKPIPLYAKKAKLDFPERSQWLGFDLAKGDWVKPWGKGVSTDILLRSNSRDMDDQNPNAHKNDPAQLEIMTSEGGGFFMVDESNGFLKLSAMKMPHLAPKGGYAEKRIATSQATFARLKPYDKDKGYFFQTRVEKEGEKIVAAHYGKIVGIIRYTPKEYPKGWFNRGTPSFGSIEFTYYFNPTQNERNLEFDPTRNLLKGLDHEERVHVP